MIDLGNMQEDFRQSLEEKFSEEIEKILPNSTQNRMYQSTNPLKDIQDMICKMTTVIMCSPNMKEKIEKLEELPNMTKIIPNAYLEDNTAYLITDEKLKKSLLRYGTSGSFP